MFVLRLLRDLCPFQKTFERFIRQHHCKLNFPSSYIQEASGFRSLYGGRFAALGWN